MHVVHFYENKISVLNQLLIRIPTIDENIQIKGRKAKVVDVIQMNERQYHVIVLFEKISKKQPLTKDLGKKKR
ncbi:hypothetical protein FCT18_07295 [Lysinibacillus sphaericus]|uniref:Uncharacterized protein n=4 Tax=Lysinibacillus TaxID=400634 RepID=A0A2S0K1I0_LYSSH|nr:MULTISPECIES: hypothetical protein [Lysinibacillus]AHN21677.1 preprotein translocase subunit SecA [Lysinibacillus varians]AVK97196.1 hypothetical protein LS41612_13445 [Lysinibacillus sphaericus]MCS1384446.1 hypothetical protein [Lysinibacillus sphaericus]MED4542487.1 hypothetical protein [Lysinibacillus sphaericus]TKI20117.1 hypothetical protein FCT18_07295 [Lysinibacillus sphaericus]